MRTDRYYSPEFSRMNFVQLLINPIIYHTQLRKEQKGTIQQNYFVLPCLFGFRWLKPAVQLIHNRYPSRKRCPLSAVIIHQIFMLACDWSKRLTWPNMPRRRLERNILRMVFAKKKEHVCLIVTLYQRTWKVNIPSAANSKLFVYILLARYSNTGRIRNSIACNRR